MDGGQYCQLNCQVANCRHCSSNANSCESCKEGYDLANSTSCVQSFCLIPFCMTCGSINTCSACIGGFNLDGTNSSCTSNCPSAGFSNCLFCTNTTCLVCNLNYVINGAQCQLPCSIPNCRACASPTLCATCAQGYYLSQNSLSCIQICRV